MSPSPAVTFDLAHELRLTTMRLARRLRSQRADHGLGLGQLSVLATLDRHGAMTAGALAAHEQIRPPSMTKTINALLEAGLVTRTPSMDDRRQIVVAPTPAARQLLLEDRRRKEEWLAEQLLALEPEQRALLSAALPVLGGLAES
jgi:DNA-binding MarR family transcriptional regulator